MVTISDTDEKSTVPAKNAHTEGKISLPNVLCACHCLVKKS